MTSVGTDAQQKINQRKHSISSPLATLFLLEVLRKYTFKLISCSKLFTSEIMDIQNNTGKKVGSQLAYSSWYS